MSHSQTVYSIDCLPTELLMSIFEDATRACVSRNTRWRTEVKLTFVCRRWRQIALDMPTLWTNIHVAVTTPIEPAKLYIERSKSHPLRFHAELTLECEDYCEEDDDDRVRYHERSELTELLLSCISQWKHLTVRIDEGAESSETESYSLASDILSQFTRIRAPLLETLKIECNGDEIHYIEDPVSLFQLGSPMLTHVEFRGICPDTCLPSSPHTLTSFALETVDGNEMHVNQMATVWKRLPALTHLALRGSNAYYSFREPMNVEFPNLFSFQVEPGCGFTIIDLFRALRDISASNLRHFSLSFLSCFEDIRRFKPEVETISIKHLDTALANYTNHGHIPFPALESLDLHLPPLPRGVSHIFAAFPSITSVSLCQFNSMLMLEAMVNDAHVVLWTKLKILILENWDYTHESKVLLELLHMRKRAYLPLTHLILRRSINSKIKAIPTSLFQELRKLVEVESELHAGDYCRYGYAVSG